MKDIIKASFSGNGFFHENQMCVYIMVFEKGQKKKYYVGRTGTSNGTGINSPFERLALHLRKTGKTSSCIWNQDFEDSVKDAEVRFYAIYIKDAVNSEKWLLRKFTQDELLNEKKTIPKAEPKIDDDTKCKLEELLRTAI